MDERTRMLMTEVMDDRLKKSMDESLDAEQQKEMLDQAMKVIDRHTEIYKNDIVYDGQVKREEFDQQEAKKGRWVKYLEIGAAVIVTPIMYYLANRALVRDIGGVEQMEHFGSTPGRSLGKMFNFRPFFNFFYKNSIFF